MKSTLYRGEVVHHRHSPRVHAFRYPYTFFAFDLEALDALHEHTLLLGYNRRALLSLRDRDFLSGTSSLVEATNTYLGAPQTNAKTFLVTSPRYLGYAFNPVNFYLRFEGEVLRSAIAEVNNTFKDRHVYPLTRLEQTLSGVWNARCPKAFHVSPFNDMEGEYAFTFDLRGDTIKLGVDLHREGRCVMQTYMRGRVRELSSRAILRYALLHPLDTALNSMPRILWQAAKLHYLKKMKVFKRPVPNHPLTIQRREDRT